MLAAYPEPVRPFVLLPAVDIAAGRSARRNEHPGRGATDADPLQSALEYQDAGAEWIHLVDLDAAFARGSNAGLLADIVARLDTAVQLSGGIRDAESLRLALHSGCARANLSTAALAYPRWCADAIAEHGERIAVSLDVRGATLAPRGEGESGRSVFDALGWLEAAGCPRYVVTDVTRDATLDGPNLELLAAICAHVAHPVIASGGIGSLDDLRRLHALASAGVEGAVVGQALHAGVFTLPAALAAVAG
jgi:1-(5-phosphoribosyl)-5-[(5-phosphoribosylamino)methylideneamino] imidazole-4-carboxamide isomerase/N-(5'phosphoribosyl)anthranilate isomerase